MTRGFASSNPADSPVQAPAGPVLVPRRSLKHRRSPLALWHLLSLDAPSVAAVWALFLARSARLRLPLVEPVAMFVAVWMIYAADRLLDAQGLDSTHSSHDRLEERHRFHHAHRGGFLCGIVAGALALVYLLQRTDDRALRLYALLAALLAAWLLVVHASARSRGQRLPKEIAVGLFFAAAVFIPTVGRLPELRVELFPSAVLFAGVCALNCLFLYAWEHPGNRPEAHGSTRWATAHLNILAAILVAASGLTAVMQRGGAGEAPVVACGLSIALLWGLHRVRSRVLAVHLRAAADLVLLTPLLWLLR
jgi:disulfide bond formation protein DsbB